MAVEAHFGGKCIDAGCVDGSRIPVKMEVSFHKDNTQSETATESVSCAVMKRLSLNCAPPVNADSHSNNKALFRLLAKDFHSSLTEVAVVHEGLGEKLFRISN